MVLTPDARPCTLRRPALSGLSKIFVARVASVGLAWTFWGAVKTNKKQMAPFTCALPALGRLRVGRSVSDVALNRHSLLLIIGILRPVLT